jgi:hypothetical protein
MTPDRLPNVLCTVVLKQLKGLPMRVVLRVRRRYVEENGKVVNAPLTVPAARKLAKKLFDEADRLEALEQASS